MSASKILPPDEYQHLNERDKLTTEASMDELAAQIVEKNYGTIRFIHALMRAMAASPRRQRRGEDRLLELLIALIENNSDLY